MAFGRKRSHGESVLALERRYIMGMKEPKGKAQKIAGTVSSPKDANQYGKIGNASTAPANVGTANIRNSNMPNPKGS